MDKIPRVGIGVFVLKDGKFIMAQRYGSHGEGTWSIPGGHLEFGETIEEGAAREVMEETGLHIHNPRILAITNDFFKDDAKHYVTIWVKSLWKAGEPLITEPDKFINFNWHTLETLPQPLFQPCWENLLSQPFDLSS